MTISNDQRRRCCYFFLLKIFVVLSISNIENVYGQQQALNLGDLLSGLQGAAKQKEDGSCPSACDDINDSIANDGNKANHFLSPAPKRRYRVYSNGCSVPEMLRDSLGDYRHFTPCCDLHDVCYAACGIPKESCEEEFGKCMKYQCKRLFGSYDLQQQYECNNLADTFMMGTTMFGCGGYNGLQKEACDCVSPSEANKRMYDYFHEFWSAYNSTHPLEIPPNLYEKYHLHEVLHHKEKNKINKKREKKHGQLLYKLYKKFPKAVHVISADGKASRQNPSYFTPHPELTQDVLDRTYEGYSNYFRKEKGIPTRSNNRGNQRNRFDLGGGGMEDILSQFANMDSDVMANAMKQAKQEAYEKQKADYEKQKEKYEKQRQQKQKEQEQKEKKTNNDNDVKDEL